MGIKNIKGDGREFEKHYRVDGEFIEFLKSHGFEGGEPEQPSLFNLANLEMSTHQEEIYVTHL
jgi:hypothetical protein